MNQHFLRVGGGSGGGESWRLSPIIIHRIKFWCQQQWSSSSLSLASTGPTFSWPHKILGCRHRVTRLCNLLHIGQLFKACGNIFFAQIILIFCEVVKIFHLSSETIFWATYRHLATFFWSHWMPSWHCWKMFAKWVRREPPLILLYKDNEIIWTLILILKYMRSIIVLDLLCLAKVHEYIHFCSNTQ